MLQVLGTFYEPHSNLLTDNPILQNQVNDVSHSTAIVPVDTSQKRSRDEDNAIEQELQHLDQRQKELEYDLAEVNALALPRMYTLDEFKHYAEMGRTGNMDDVGRQYFTDFMDLTDLRSFRGASYRSDAGIAIRWNAALQCNEMFIPGTHWMNPRDHLQNIAEAASNLAQNKLLEGVVTAASTVFEQPELIEAYQEYKQYAIAAGDVSKEFRRKYADELSQLAKKYNVKVIYGHSRGAAVMSDMNVDGAVKIGLNGATELIDGDPDFVNFVNKGGLPIFDWLISKKKGRVGLKSRGFHDVTKTSRPAEKRLSKQAKKIRSYMGKKNEYRDVKRPKKSVIGRIKMFGDVAQNVGRKEAGRYIKNQISNAAFDAAGEYVPEPVLDIARNRSTVRATFDKFARDPEKFRNTLNEAQRKYQKAKRDKAIWDKRLGYGSNAYWNSLVEHHEPEYNRLQDFEEAVAELERNDQQYAADVARHGKKISQATIDAIFAEHERKIAREKARQAKKDHYIQKSIDYHYGNIDDQAFLDELNRQEEEKLKKEVMDRYYKRKEFLKKRKRTEPSPAMMRYMHKRNPEKYPAVPYPPDPPHLKRNPPIRKVYKGPFYYAQYPPNPPGMVEAVRDKKGR